MTTEIAPTQTELQTLLEHAGRKSKRTRSDDGERFAERALSAAGTCRQQGRSLSEHLVELITAHNRGDPLPRLT